VILSSHSDDEVYLGQRDTPEWTSDARAQEAFRRFGARVTEIESRVVAMNADPRLKNRSGPAKVPYMSRIHCGCVCICVRENY
jgi:linoleate 9S-lipoxygenase